MIDIEWRSMPSLSSLRAFEATARAGSFSSAARALNVTHAAVAQQVRALEAFLGVPLVNRDGRGLALTPEGERLAATLSDGFETIQSGISRLRRTGAADSVRVTLTSSFAAQWLMPRLRDFWTKHPEIPLSLHPEASLTDLKRAGMDLGIRYGKGDWKGVTARRLTSARLVVVGSPAFAHQDPQDAPWILAENWPEQNNWLLSQGLDPARLKKTYLPDEDLALAAARQGLGLTVESHALVEADLEAGRLAKLIDGQEDLPAYFVVTLDPTPRKAARTFINWLFDQV